MKKRIVLTCSLIAFASFAQAQTTLTPNYTRILHDDFRGTIKSVSLLSQRVTVYSYKSNYSRKHFVSTFDTTSGTLLNQVIDAIYYPGSMTSVREMPSRTRFCAAYEDPDGLDYTGRARLLEFTPSDQVIRHEMSDRAQFNFWDVAESGRRRWILCGGETLRYDDPDSGFPDLWVKSNDGTEWHYRPLEGDPSESSDEFLAGAIDNQGNTWTIFHGKPTPTDPQDLWLVRLNSTGQITGKFTMPNNVGVRFISTVRSVTPGTNREDALIFTGAAFHRADLLTGLGGPVPFNHTILSFQQLASGQFFMKLDTPGIGLQMAVVNQDFTIAETYPIGDATVDRLDRVVRSITALAANESRFQIETGADPIVFSVPGVGSLATLGFDRYQNLVLTTYVSGRMRLVGVSNLQDLTGPAAPVAPGANVQFRINLNFNAPPSGLRVLLYSQPGLTLPTEVIVPPGANSFTVDGNVTATDARTIRVRAKAAGKSVYSSVTVAP
jgi:hypothetical protein